VTKVSQDFTEEDTDIDCVLFTRTKTSSFARGASGQVPGSHVICQVSESEITGERTTVSVDLYLKFRRRKGVKNSWNLSLLTLWKSTENTTGD
jgi:hypothetical protein